MKRVSKRVGNTVIKGYEVDGVFYRTKKEAGLARVERSDKKCVSHNNIVPVVYKLLLERGTELLNSIEGSDADAQLVCDTWDAVQDMWFLLFRCAPSYNYWMEKQNTARKVCYLFLNRFYPEGLENVQNKSVTVFKVTTPNKVYEQLDDSDDVWLNDWRTAHAED